MAAGLAGKWESVAKDNLEALFDVMMVSPEKRQKARDATVHLELSKVTDQEWKISRTIGEEKWVMAYPLGELVYIDGLQRKRIKSVLNSEGGSLVEKQEDPRGDVIIRRSLVNGNLISEITNNGVTATIRFTRKG